MENGVSPVVGGEEPELGAQREAPGRDDTGLAWAVRPWGKGDLRNAVTVVPRRQQQAHLSTTGEGYLDGFKEALGPGGLGGVGIKRMGMVPTF